MYTEAEFLEKIDAFRTANGGMKESIFGMKALGDPNFVGDVRSRAKSPKLKTVRKVIAFMENYKPEKEK